MDYLIVCLAAFLASGLTLFSGFGLGTILVPVFALFFPVEMAIAATAIVHFLNNLFKLAILGKHANVSIVLKFGIPAIPAAFAGAYVLSFLTSLPPLLEYSLQHRNYMVVPVKLTVGILLLVFSLFELVPALEKLEFRQKHLPFGGLLSGFFGGLSGHQGALRSAFLIRAKLSKEQFIASGVVIACLVDISRLSIYWNNILNASDEFNFILLSAATLSAFLGAYMGNRLIGKITVKAFQNLVAGMLFIFSILLSMGMI